MDMFPCSELHICEYVCIYMQEHFNGTVTYIYVSAYICANIYCTWSCAYVSIYNWNCNLDKCEHVHMWWWHVPCFKLHICECVHMYLNMTVFEPSIYVKIYIYTYEWPNSESVWLFTYALYWYLITFRICTFV